MGNLFDELKKAKLIDKTRAKQLEHEKRVERKESGGDVAADEELTRKAEAFEESRDLERRRQRETAKQRKAAQRDRERRAEVKQLVASRKLGEEAVGSKRWHFRTPTGALPFLPVNEMTAKRL